MSLSINNIRAHLTEGGARPSLFQVHLTNPIAGGADQIAPFLIKAAQLPRSSLGKIPVPYMGRTMPIPGDRVFDDWTVTVINDENFKVRDALEAWSGMINSHRGNVAGRGSSLAPYMGQGTVTQLSKTGAALRIYQFNNIWPMDIAQIDLDWGTVDTIEEFQVTFAFEDWTIVGGKTGDALGTTGDLTSDELQAVADNAPAA